MTLSDDDTTRPEDATQPEDATPPSWSEQELRQWIVRRLADAAGTDASQVDPTATFSALGVDSVAAVELVADLEATLGRELDPTLVFSAETPVQLAATIASGATGPRPRRRHAPSMSVGDEPEPIAVVGVGCRFPGARGPDAYWQMLIDGTDAVRTVPSGRWEHDPSLPPTVDLGGFVDDIEQFDPGFFGITQLEADRMDPQQRMLLEVAWEAFEDAAIRPSTVRGTDVGVFVGISANEYSRRQSASPELIDVFFGTGNALSIAANRVSYALDLHGPSIAVDTACSSSLVAVHLACASIRRGECASALAGGANAILTPLLTLNFTGAGVIAPDGRCKTFDASADGIVRGEGAGLVLLKRLSDATADGDRIYCVIDGSATNQDGRSNGLTAPQPDAQMDVFSSACAAARVDPTDVDYVEAHGTGTVLGDAMELRSLDAVYGTNRPGERPLLVGSVKTNIGHLESAAGVAGLIKTALALRHARIPPTLHYRKPNPYLSETNHISVVDDLVAWDHEGTRRAAVSGFGFGGTNAHVILSAAPEPLDHRAPLRRAGEHPEIATAPIVLPLSARSAPALAASVDQHALRLGAAPEEARDLAAAQALTREEHPRRLAVVAADGTTVATALAEVASGRRHPGVVAGERRSTEPARVAFLFSGQGRAWWPLDTELLADPVIAAVLRTCDTELRELAPFSLLELIGSGEAVLDHERAQPLLFALQVALAARWRAFGVEPDLIVGQSIGEIAAAHVAGALPLADALEVVLHRGRLMEESNGTGHTAFVELPAAEVEAMIAHQGLDVTIAAVTAPDNCVVSGPKQDTVAIVDAAVASGVMAQVFDVGDIPGHGPLMGPYAEKLTAAIDFIDPRATTVPMISSVTAAPVRGEELDAEYWGRNLRRQVRLLEAVEVAAGMGAELFIEIAPHPVVSFSTRRTLEAIGSDARVQHTVKQGEPGAMALRRSLAAAWTSGASVDWRAVTGRTRAPVEALPSPWDHRRCWFDLEAPQQRATAVRRSGWHPELDDGTGLGDGTTTWRSDAAAAGPDLGVLDVGRAIELALAAVRSSTGAEQVALSDVRLATGTVRSTAAGTAPVPWTVTVTARPDGLHWWIAADGGGLGPTATDDATSARVLARGRARVLDGRTPVLLAPELLAIDAPSGDVGLPAHVSSAKADDRSAVVGLDVPAAPAGAPAWVAGPRLVDAVVASAVRFGPTAPVDDDRVELQAVAEVRLLGDPAAATRAVVDRVTGDVTVIDEWRAPLLEVHGVTATPAHPTAPAGDVVVPAWSVPSSIDADRASTTSWIVLAAPDDAPAADLARSCGSPVLDDAGALVALGSRPECGAILLDPTPERVAGLLAAPEVDGRTLLVVTHGGDVDALLPGLISDHPGVELRSVRLDDDPASGSVLVDLLHDGLPSQVLSVTAGRATVGQLVATPVPDITRSTAPAGQREHAAVWGEDATLHIVAAPLAPPAAGIPEPSQVTVVVERAVLAGAGTELSLAGEVAGVGAVGRVHRGPAELRGQRVAVVARGAATTRLDADVDAVWPAPDADAAVRALTGLLALHPDLPTAVAAAPEVLHATFAALLAHPGSDPPQPMALADLAGSRPRCPTVVVLGDPSTPVEDMSERWDATGRWAVLAAEDDPLGDAVLSWLRDRDAEIVAVEPEPRTDAPLTGVVAIGDAPLQRLDGLGCPVIWIAPSTLLLGGGPIAPATCRAAATMARRRDSGRAGTTFCVGGDVDHLDALRVLDRVLSAGIDVAAYDPARRSELAAATPTPGGWFAPLWAPQQPESVGPADVSLTAALVAAAADERLGVLRRHVATEIATIIGIDESDIDTAEPVDTYGVDSLVGMEMRTRIQSSFAYEVPLTELSRSMTVDDLSAHLLEHAVPALLSGRGTPSGGAGDTTGPVDGSAAVAVARGDGPTSWWVPGIFGAPEVFGPLGHALLGHDMWALAAGDAPPSSVTAAAEMHLRTIRSRQPSGPYRIGGYSYGALVAAEIAVALESAGDEVERLWLLDPPPITPDTDGAISTARVRTVRELLAEHLVELFGTGDLTAEELPPLGPDVARRDLDALAARLSATSSTWSSRQALEHLLRVWSTTAASLQAMDDHSPTTTIDAATDLVVAEHSGLSGHSPEAGWTAVLAGPVTATTFDTDHSGLLRAAHAAAVAEVVRRSLGAPTHITATNTEDPMTTDAAPATRARRARHALLSGLTASPRSRSAVGAVGNAYRQADFFLRALGAERRFRRMCVTGEDFIVGEHAQIANLSGDPGRIRFGHNCLVDGYINLQEHGYFTMGSYSGLGEGVRIDCAGYVEIGNGCTMAEGVYVIDGLHHPILADERIRHGIDLFQGDHVMDAYGPGTETSFVRIEDLVWIGLRAIVLSGVTIGRGSVVAAGAVVSQDIPPFSVVAGNPARVVGRIPAEDFDIESHPTFRAARGDQRLPDHRRPVREVLDEIAARVAARRG